MRKLLIKTNLEPHKVTRCMAEEAVVELGLEAGDLGRTRTLGRLVREGNHNILHIFLIFLKRI